MMDTTPRTQLRTTLAQHAAAFLARDLIPNDACPRGEVYALPGRIVTGHTLTLNAITHHRDPHAELDALLAWIDEDYLDDLPQVRKWRHRTRRVRPYAEAA